MPSKPRAYAEQALADFRAYIASGEADENFIGEHHRLQLLQMALEKLAKAFFYHAEPDARYPHNVALSAINRLRSHAIAEAMGLKLRSLIWTLDSAKPVFLQIEAASPSVGLDGASMQILSPTSSTRFPSNRGRPGYRPIRIHLKLDYGQQVRSGPV